MHTTQLDPSLTCACYSLYFIDKFISTIHRERRRHFIIAFFEISEFIGLALVRRRHYRRDVSRFLHTRERLSIKEKVEFTRFPGGARMLWTLRGFSCRHGGLEFQIVHFSDASTSIQTIHARASLLLEYCGCSSCHRLHRWILLVRHSRRHFDWFETLHSFLEILSLDCHYHLRLLEMSGPLLLWRLEIRTRVCGEPFWH